jgi:hypothetical protein
LAIPKSTAQTSVDASAYFETSVDFASIAAGAEGTVQVTLPKKFALLKPVLVQLKTGESAFAAGLVLAVPSFDVNSGKLRVTLRLRNESAGAIDPPAKVFQFLQL